MEFSKLSNSMGDTHVMVQDAHVGDEGDTHVDNTSNGDTHVDGTGRSC